MDVCLYVYLMHVDSGTSLVWPAGSQTNITHETKAKKLQSIGSQWFGISGLALTGLGYVYYSFVYSHMICLFYKYVYVYIYIYILHSHRYIGIEYFVN